MGPEEFKERRETLNLSQSELAATLGISVDTVQNWEQGRNSIPPYLSLAFDALDYGSPVTTEGISSVTARQMAEELLDEQRNPDRARRKNARRLARLEAQHGLRYAEDAAKLDAEIEVAEGRHDLIYYLARREINPIIFRKGCWALTTYGIERLDRHYPIEGDRLREGDWIDHLREKGTVSRENLADFAECLEYALTHNINYAAPVAVPEDADSLA